MSEFIPYQLPRLSEQDMVARSKEFLRDMEGRRSARVFSPEAIPLEAVRHCNRGDRPVGCAQTALDLLPGHRPSPSFPHP